MPSGLEEGREAGRDGGHRQRRAAARRRLPGLSSLLRGAGAATGLVSGAEEAGAGADRRAAEKIESTPERTYGVSAACARGSIATRPGPGAAELPAIVVMPILSDAPDAVDSVGIPATHRLPLPRSSEKEATANARRMEPQRGSRVHPRAWRVQSGRWLVRWRRARRPSVS